MANAANAKKKTHRRKKFTLALGIVAGFAPGVMHVATAFQQAGPAWALNKASVVYLGYDPNSGQFNPGWMKWGTYPLIGGLILHKVASMLGVNRMLAQAGVPIIRL